MLEWSCHHAFHGYFQFQFGGHCHQGRGIDQLPGHGGLVMAEAFVWCGYVRIQTLVCLQEFLSKIISCAFSFYVMLFYVILQNSLNIFLFYVTKIKKKI